MPTEPTGADRDRATDLVLRPAAGADLQAVADVHLAARAAAPMPPPVHDEPAVRAWIAHLPERHEVWVADDGGVLVGYAVWDEQWLDSLYVHPDHQGRGVGTALLDVVKGRCPDGFGLWVFVANEPARAFYAGQGLVELEHTDGSANEEREPDVRMAWLGERPLAHLRARIDEVDDDLAVLLGRRAALTAAVQDHKLATGTEAGAGGRDPGREAEIVQRMLRHAPDLGPEGLARVMHAVIEESLRAWEETRGFDAG